MQHPHYAKVVQKYLLTSTNVEILTQEALLGMMQHRTTRRSCLAHALLVQKYLRTSTTVQILTLKALPKVAPKFCKRYSSVGVAIHDALLQV